ncbi:MAG: hypothetical protein AAGK97_18880, partial [Bacteroidota bacterium]
LRLGKIKKDITSLEPILRNVKLGSFDISSINGAVAPGQFNPWPSGLTAEEACQTTRYLGISDSVEIFEIYGIHLANDKKGLTSKNIAQMIWYFVEGVNNRKYDFKNERMLQYTVNVNDFDLPIEFIKSEKSDRWWIKIPGNESGLDVFPCSYEDYEMACNNNLSERILKLITI